MRVPSNGYDEKYGWAGAFPGMREFVGDRVFGQLTAADYALINRHWESSLIIKRNDLDDDRTGMYGPVLGEMGLEAAYHPDELLFETIVNGESAESFDGVAFYSTSHVWNKSGTQSNNITAPAVDPANPTPDEFLAAFENARKSMLGYKKDNGKFWHRPTLNKLGNLLLTVPTGMEVSATKALTVQLSGGGNTHVVIEQAEIQPVQYLANAAKFQLHKTGSPFGPFVYQDRAPLKTETKGLNDIETKDVKFMTESRYAIGYGGWWNSVNVTFV